MKNNKLLPLKFYLELIYLRIKCNKTLASSDGVGAGPVNPVVPNVAFVGPAPAKDQIQRVQWTCPMA